MRARSCFSALLLLAACSDAAIDAADELAPYDEAPDVLAQFTGAYPTLVHLYDSTQNNIPEWIWLHEGIVLNTSLTTNGAIALLQNESGVSLTLEGTSLTVECSNGQRGGTGDNRNFDIPSGSKLLDARCPSGSTPQRAILLVTSIRCPSSVNGWRPNSLNSNPGQGHYYHSNYPTEVNGADGSFTTLERGSSGNSLVGTFRNNTSRVQEINFSLSGSCPGKNTADTVSSGARRVNPNTTTTIELKCESGMPRLPLFDIAGWRPI